MNDVFRFVFVRPAWYFVLQVRQSGYSIADQDPSVNSRGVDFHLIWEDVGMALSSHEL